MSSESRKKQKEDSELIFIDEGPNDNLIPGQRFGVQVKVPALFDEQSKFQHVQLFESVAHGKVMVLDGVVQLSESDEFAYHEMAAHVPLYALDQLLQSQKKPKGKKRVLLIGAGDGGVLREILKHESVSSFFVCDGGLN